MKTLCIFIFLSVCAVALASPYKIEKNDDSTYGALEIVASIFLELIKRILKVGVPILGIPSLNPLHIEHESFEFDVEKYIRGTIDFDDLNLKGLPDFKVPQLKIKLGSDLETPSFNFTFLFEDINLETSYVLDTTVLQFIPVHGKGIISATLKNLQLECDIVIKKETEEVPYLFHRIDLFPTLGDSEFHISGLLNDDEFSKILASTIKEYLAPIINENSHYIRDLVGDFLLKYLNELLIC